MAQLQSLKVLALFVCISWCAFAEAGDVEMDGAAGATFSVGTYGARADGKTDDSNAFMKTWQAACASSGKVKIQIPGGKYLLGPLTFSGPCPKVTMLTIVHKGTLLASTNLGKFKSDVWLEFYGVKGLRISGGGTVDGQGAAAWDKNSCHKMKNCQALPVSVKFIGMNDTIVRGLTSVNPKFFHMAVIDCQRFTATDLTLTAPEDSPNTDGCHIEGSTGVEISRAKIGTGDDCISIGHGNTDVLISSVECGPGHGLSIGSLGKYKYEKDVKGLIIRDSKITSTQNGVRIKTWENSPVSTIATNITFENIIMSNVSNPIIIDQTYCPFKNCGSKDPSKVKLSNIHFTNIRGTSATPVAVTLECSKGYPCQNVNLKDIQLKYINGSDATLACANVSPQFSGTVNPKKCTAPIAAA
ncbi:Pectin lyase-like superfamily protein [Rhynchospora pubera]|uniref:Exopolygalacturonase n=2 Tax=Rhynchospora pubera TaxID=906938 RepID=A0AAV8GY73_9POAL|nr:Pectin lyase-like superfamily protein [Rhynchospora pubera]KAJ4809394.1 Pectin lyase-like superfamily protein [Rhynchospora pubera]